jgi:hypothetical protein
LDLDRWRNGQVTPPRPLWLTKYALEMNPKTAKALDLEVPLMLLTLIAARSLRPTAKPGQRRSMPAA